MIVIMLDEIIKALQDGSSKVRCECDSTLFFRGDVVEFLFVLQKGQIALTRHMEDGNELVLCRAVGPCILAEASVYSKLYHCDAVALSECELRKVSKNDFISLLASSPAMANSWSAHLAQSLQTARQHSEILRLKKVRDRIDAWSALNGGELPPKGQWKGFAAQIGVSVEALYRELATRDVC